MIEYLPIVTQGLRACFLPVLVLAFCGAVAAWKFRFQGWRLVFCGQALTIIVCIMIAWRVLFQVSSSRYFCGVTILCILFAAYLLSFFFTHESCSRLSKKIWRMAGVALICVLCAVCLGKAIPRNSKKEMVAAMSSLLSHSAATYRYPVLLDASEMGKVISFYAGNIPVLNIADIRKENAEYWLADKRPYHDALFIMIRRKDRKRIEQYFPIAGISPELLSGGLEGPWELYRFETPESRMGYAVVESVRKGGTVVFSDPTPQRLENPGFCRYDLPGKWKSSAYEISFSFTGRRGTPILFLAELFDSRGRHIKRERDDIFYCVFPDETRQIRFAIPAHPEEGVYREFTIAAYDGPLTICDLQVVEQEDKK